MIRRAPLHMRICLEGLGQRPPNAIHFEPGQQIGVHTIVKRVGTWSGSARWQLRCPEGHFFERAAPDIQKSLAGKKGPITCRECQAMARQVAP